MGREKRRRYSKQFKADAVSLIVEQDYGTPEAAKRLGINANMLNCSGEGAETVAGHCLISQ